MHFSHNQEQSDISDITGVILAGGLSRRMGRDKATLLVEGKSLFDRSRDMLSTLFSTLIIAGDRPDLATPNIPCYPDIYPGSSLGGIHGGLHAARTSWIFVSPCDLADPDPQLVKLLLDERKDVDAVVLRTPDGPEPVFALYHKNCLDAMEAMLTAGHCRIFDLYERISVRYLDPARSSCNWQRALCNLNSPDDLLRLHQERS